MIRRYVPILTVLAFALMALPAVAQDEPRGPSFELFGGAGALYSSSSGLSLRTETVGARGGFSLSRVWTVEAALSRTSGDPITWNGEVSAKAYLFQNERVRLFALAGPGIRHEDLAGGSVDAATVHVGIGVEIALSPKFYLRPELRSRWPTAHFDEGHRSEDLTLGVGWRF